MRVLFDVVHPAHVHFYKHIATELRSEGVPVLILSRAKDATNALLADLDLPYRSHGRPHDSTVGQAAELANRVRSILGEAREFKPTLVLTRNPAGALASRLVNGAISVFDTDDGRAAGLHYRLGAAAAHVVTAPSCLSDTGGRDVHKYPGLKALAYLHPKRFRPDPQIRQSLDVGARPFALLRLVSMTASHDRKAQGIQPELLRQLLERLTATMEVFVSMEKDLPLPAGTRQLPTAPSDLHSVVAEADFYLGDSQTMAIEAALLGTPVLHLSSWSGKLDCLEYLQERQMITSFHPRQTNAITASLATTLRNVRETKRLQMDRASRFAAPEYDVTQWYVQLIHRLQAGGSDH